MNYSSVTNPVFSNAENTLITATVNFDALGTQPFCASPNDSEAHGREIFALCMAGEFGEVAPYVEPAIDPKYAIRTEIFTLEASITPRRLRDAVLTGDKSFIAGVDYEIAKLRAQL